MHRHRAQVLCKRAIGWAIGWAFAVSCVACVSTGNSRNRSFLADSQRKHVSDKGVPYEFRDAHQLLSDFFTEVDRVLEEIKAS